MELRDACQNHCSLRLAGISWHLPRTRGKRRLREHSKDKPPDEPESKTSDKSEVKCKAKGKSKYKYKYKSGGASSRRAQESASLAGPSGTSAADLADVVMQSPDTNDAEVPERGSISEVAIADAVTSDDPVSSVRRSAEGDASEAQPVTRQKKA